LIFSICLTYANIVQRGPDVPANPIPFPGFGPAAGAPHVGDGDDDDEDNEGNDDGAGEETGSSTAFESMD
jgi:hypothetical protein